MNENQIEIAKNVHCINNLTNNTKKLHALI